MTITEQQATTTRGSTLLGHVAAVVFNNRIHVALMPSFLLLFWTLAFGFALPLEYYAMVTLSTAGGYLYNMLTDRREDAINYPTQGRLSPDSRWMKTAILLCTVASGLLALRAGWRFFLFGSLVCCMGPLYGMTFELPIGGRRRRFRMKNVPVLKNAWAALFWSVVLLTSPFVYLGMPFDRRLALAIPIAFLLAFWVELMWDVRDMAGDRDAGVRTLPVVLGEQAARRLLHAINATTATLAVIGLIAGILPPQHWVLAVHAAGVAVFIEWYLRQRDRQLGSHLYLLYAGACIAAAIAFGHPLQTIWPHL
jgi:4-hydroxybenzoate polyprenyltransferase